MKLKDKIAIVTGGGRGVGRGFTPYGPSRSALESMCVISAQELEGT